MLSVNKMDLDKIISLIKKKFFLFALPATTP